MFEVTLQSLQAERTHGSIEFAHTETSYRQLVASHFPRATRPAYGVYIVRLKSSQEVIYIGIAGTVRADGSVQSQDLPKRLASAHGESGTSRLITWRDVHGDALVVEYIVLPPVERLTPALAQALLLQAYLSEFHRLPYYNKSF